MHISAPFCFKIPNPGPQIRQIPNPEIQIREIPDPDIQIRQIPDPQKPIGNPRYSRTCNAEKVIVSRRTLRTSSPWPFGGVASPSRLASFPPEIESLLLASPRSRGRLSKLPNEGRVLRDSCTRRLRLKLSLRLRQH